MRTPNMDRMSEYKNQHLDATDDPPEREPDELSPSERDEMHKAGVGEKEL